MVTTIDKRSASGASDKVPAEIRYEVATAARDITRFSYGGTALQNTDPTLATRGDGRGVEMYDDLERDCHAAAVLQKRRLAVISREWEVEPGGEAPIDVEAAEEVRRQLAALNFDQLCDKLLDAILKGYAVAEVIWEAGNGAIEARAVKSRNQRRFTFDQDGALRLLTWENMTDGEAVPERKFIIHRHGDKHENPFGLGLGTRLFWPVFFKRQGITFWLTFADKFGSPTAVGKYPQGADAAGRAKLMDALTALANDVGVTIPEDMKIEFLEASRSGSIDTYEKLARYMDEQMSEAVLGETGSTNQSGAGGSRARDQVGNEVRLEISKADADLLCATLNETLVKWISELNFPGAALPKVWRDFEEDEDLNARAERDAKIVGTNQVRLRKRYWMRVYGFREDEIEEREPMPGATGAPGGEPGVSFAEGRSDMTTKLQRLKDRRNPPEADNTPLGKLVSELEQAAQPELKKMVERIRTLLDESKTLEEFRDGLLDLAMTMDAGTFAEILQRSMVAAEMSGRFEVLDGR